MVAQAHRVATGDQRQWAGRGSRTIEPIGLNLIPPTGISHSAKSISHPKSEMAKCAN